jgi:hypothetical protein
LRTLNSSPRYWSSFVSVSRICFSAEKSQFTYPGPSTTLRPSSPNCADGRIRVLGNSLKRTHVEPSRRGARARIRIAHNVGPVGGKSRNLRCRPLQGNIVGIENREGGATHGGCKAVQLPITQSMSVPGTGMWTVGNAPLIAQENR